MNNLIRKPQISSEQRNYKYGFYGFTQNPFPFDPSVIPGSDDKRNNGTLFYEGMREQEMNDFKEKLVKSPNRIGILMDYAAYKGRGIGKTALLNHVKTIINSDLGLRISDGQEVLYSIYLSPNSSDGNNRSMSRMAHSLFDAMINERMLFITFCRLRAFSGGISDDLLTEISEDDYESSIADDKWLTEHGADLPRINNYLVEKLYSIGFLEGSPSYRLSFGYKDFLNAISSFHSEMEWSKKGLQLIFNKLVLLFKEAAFSNCIILLDEVEKIVQYQNFSERRAFCDDLRFYFIDGNTENSAEGFFKILITIHPNSQELLMPHWMAAGLERFCELGGSGAKESTIFFKPMKDDINLIKDFVKIYLDNSRSNKSDSVEPFTDDALLLALRKSDNIAGKFLKMLYFAVENGIANQWKTIGTDKIEELTRDVIKKTDDGKSGDTPLDRTITEL